MIAKHLEGNMPTVEDLTPWSRGEYERTPLAVRDTFIQRSENVWRVMSEDGETLMIVGVYVPALIGPLPEVWVLLCTSFYRNLRRNLREVLRLFRQLHDLYPVLQVRVNATFQRGKRFAKFVGFTATREVHISDDLTYIIFETRNGI